MQINDSFEYNNEEEAEIAQIRSLQIHMEAVAKVRQEMEKLAENPSAEFCEDCGDDIPEARRKLIPGVQLCVHCQDFREKHRNFGKIKS